jgi:SAM-dependent methyltransferase
MLVHPEAMTSQPDAGADLEAWEAAAEAYGAMVGSGDTITERFRHFLAQAIGRPGGLDILDLGCSHGWLAGELASQGARVTGVDGSGVLLEIARAKHPAVTFHQGDLTNGLPRELARATFDRVVAFMVLMDVGSLDQLMADVQRCVRPDGRFVITMTHPAFWSQAPVDDTVNAERYRKVRGYLEHEERWVSSFGGHRHYHRPLGWYVECLGRHGLVVTELHGRPPPAGGPRSNAS